MEFDMRSMKDALIHGFRFVVLGLLLVTVPAAYAQDADEEEDSSSGYSSIEEIVVTAERREQSLQDVPISVAAFDEAALTRQAIDSVSDVQLNTPNLVFSKGNFSGAGNITIRGVGALCTAASCEGAARVHINSAEASGARIFETEFFDVRAIEVSRGPQGTLFGRNSTAGVLNILLNKPDTEEFGLSFDIGIGNYGSRKSTFTLNTPFGDGYGGNRLSVYQHKRDGFVTNDYALAGGVDPLGRGLPTKLDNRDIEAFRNVTTLYFGESVRLDLTLATFEEDDNRMRISNQRCTKDTTGIQGCVLGDNSPGLERSNSRGTLASIWSSNWAPGYFGNGLIPYPGITTINQDGFPSGQPGSTLSGIRNVYLDYTPTHFASEDLIILELAWDITDELTLTYVASDIEVLLSSTADYDYGVPGATFNVVDSFGANVPVYNTAIAPDIDGDGDGDYTAVVGAPITGAAAGHGRVFGVSIGGHSQNHLRSFTHDRPYGWDETAQETESSSHEIRLASDYAGGINFQVGINSSKQDVHTQYWVIYNTLEAFVRQSLARYGVAGAQLAGGVSFAAATTNAINGANVGNFYLNESYIYTESDSIFGEIYFDVGEAGKITIGARSNEDVRTLISPTDTFLGGVGGTGVNAPRSSNWDETTGRVVYDHKLSDNKLIYGSFARGYKGGGFNPVSSGIGQVWSSTYEPEYIDAIEIGGKMQFLDNTLQLNWAYYSYDFEGLQVSAIIDRNAINSNIDATLSGFEVEALWAPLPNLRLDATIGTIDSEVAAGTMVLNPNQLLGTNAGTAGYQVCKDLQQAFFYTSSIGTCNVIPDLSPDDSLYGYFNLNVAASAAGSFTNGYLSDLSGNTLPNSPEFSLKLGVEFSKVLCCESRYGEMAFSFRVDYYKRDNFYTSVFNENSTRIDSWDQINMHIALTSLEGKWDARLSVLNVADADEITGHYLTDASSGGFQNVFLLDPRTLTLSLSMDF